MMLYLAYCPIVRYCFTSACFFSFLITVVNIRFLLQIRITCLYIGTDDLNITVRISRHYLVNQKSPHGKVTIVTKGTEINDNAHDTYGSWLLITILNSFMSVRYKMK